MPKANAKHKYVYPELPEGYSGCTEAVVCIPAEWIPILAGHIAQLELSYAWSTDADWRKALPFIVKLQEDLMSSCLSSGIQTLIDEQRRLYRLMDSALNGVTYTATRYGPIGGGGGGWGGGGGGGGSYGGSGGGGGSWGSDEDSTYTYVPTSDPDGGDLYVVDPPLPLVPPEPQMIPSSRLERLITAVDGGEDVPPGDSVLEALRGNTQASNTRNIAELLIELRERLVEADPNGDSLIEEVRKLLV